MRFAANRNEVPPRWPHPRFLVFGRKFAQPLPHASKPTEPRPAPAPLFRSVQYCYSGTEEASRRSRLPTRKRNFAGGSKNAVRLGKRLCNGRDQNHVDQRRKDTRSLCPSRCTRSAATASAISTCFQASPLGMIKYLCLQSRQSVFKSSIKIGSGTGNGHDA